jgi:HEPN domain-containing protein
MNDERSGATSPAAGSPKGTIGDWEQTREDAAAWLTKARGDLLAAETLATPAIAQRDIAIYHCQQAAEKAIKGLLVYRERPFQKTHDLERLLELARDETDSLFDLEEHARTLTPYAVEFRYPGDIFEPDEEEMQEAIRLAREVVEKMSGLILNGP